MPLRQAQGKLSRQPAGPFDSAQGRPLALQPFFRKLFHRVPRKLYEEKPTLVRMDVHFLRCVLHRPAHAARDVT